MEELYEGLKTHKELVHKWYPDYIKSHGVGRDAFVSKEDLVCSKCSAFQTTLSHHKGFEQGVDPEVLRKNTDSDLKKAPGVNAMQANGFAKDAGIIDGGKLHLMRII